MNVLETKRLILRHLKNEDEAQKSLSMSNLPLSRGRLCL